MMPEHFTHVVGNRTWYVARNDLAAVTYEREWFSASTNVHTRIPAEGIPCDLGCENGVDEDGDECFRCHGTGRLRGKPCEFLDGDHCLMDGTSLSPILTDEREIHRHLEVWLPTQD